ncbi:Calumenin-B [Habropoda laboriosa]|uniref:Reticulocalbin-3 n=1 Tax=Habropoda laboriosa TaxID=597456 RepID=A0A0L7QY92_9HYME|nr:PREDICTED: calumenin [Habropoda laboriosa]XP_017791923.1 PREDICTED: calumenin [Habropoda laboriosa]KOC63572.1 Calumenin-B [Habropoda laboriosa]
MQEFMLLQILIGFSVLATAIPKPENDHKPRIINKEPSKKEHFVNSQHNPAYDHEAFLGEEAKTFDQLTPEESARRLGIIVDKIDKDKNGYVTGEELKDWILYTQQRYIRDNVEREWKSHNPEEKEKLPWTEYLAMVYGDMNEHEAENHEKSKDNVFSYVAMLKKDHRRWTAADLDGDDALTKKEFAAFLHAEEADHMKDVVVLETMEDIDKDGDGKISLSEYIGDMYDGAEGEEEPEWVKNEKEQFSMYRDKDGDGFLDFDEVKTWIIPPDFDHAEAESRHLIFEADTDADQKLTKDEILEKYDIFVGSQATDFGEALARHDEF